MKKIILYAIAIFGAINSIAQNKITYGIQVSSGATKLTRFPITAQEFKTHFFVLPSILTEVKITNKLALRTGIGYWQSGVTIINPFVSTSTTNPLLLVKQGTTLRINNINMPAELCFPINIGENKLLLMCGPSFNYAINGSSKNFEQEVLLSMGKSSDNILNEIKSNLKFGPYDYHRFTAAAKFGLAFQSKEEIEFSANYAHGLIDIHETLYAIKSFNNIAVGLTYFFKK